MSGATPYETFCALGIPPFTTYDEWSEATLKLRLRAMPHVFDSPVFTSEPEFRFGAFLGWHWEDAISPRFVEVASAMGPEALAATGLLNTDHQCGGHYCWSTAFMARAVAISGETLPVAADICLAFHYAWGGHFCVTPNNTDPDRLADFRKEAARYRAQWAAVGLVADRALDPAGGGFMEGVYPLDASPENLSRFLAHPDAEVRALGPLAADPGLRSQLTLVTLADNSD